MSAAFAPLRLPAAPERDEALDYAQLFEIGMRRIRSAARETWSDHNVHDPAITALELASFALSELAYRAQFAIEDLLASHDNAAPLATPRDALTNAPITLADYRRLLIDLPGVRNAWLLPKEIALEVDPITKQLRAPTNAAEATRVSVAGVWSVLLDFEGGLEQSAHAAVVGAARALLHSNRSLCEDFAEIDVVAIEEFIVCGDFELAPDANVSETAARILFAANSYFAPAVHSYSLGEMRALRKPDGSVYELEEIFSGPPLVHGFIPEEELARGELRKKLHLSDLYSELGRVPGVGAISELRIGKKPLEDAPSSLSLERPPDHWELDVASGKKARLAIEGSSLIFRKQGLPIAPNRERVQARYAALEREAAARRERVQREDLAPPRGRARKLASYRSIQLDFPTIFDLASESFEDETRKAQVLQWKAYLLFFDQLMADYLARLAQAPALLSAPAPNKVEPWRTQAYAPVEFPASGELYVGGDGGAALAKLADEQREQQAAQRNRLLDHLIARFAERFHELAGVLYENFGDDADELIRVKSEFLHKCSALGSARSLGYDHTRAAFGSQNVSGLERRVCALLGIPNASRRSLIGVAHEVFAEATQTGVPARFRFRIKRADTGAILLSSTDHYASEREAYEGAARALALARDPGRYEQRGTAPDFYFVLRDREDDDIAMRRQMFATPDARDEALAETQRLTSVGEGLHVIESLLLLSRPAGPPFLTICSDPDCSECGANDPYSYRLHVVLPAFAGRFADMDFRRFAEDLIRAETPAHVLPKVCWLGAGDLAAVERALLAIETQGPDAARLRALIDALQRGKSVYPQGHLHDCVEEAPGPPFVLGRSILGTHTHDED